MEEASGSIGKRSKSSADLRGSLDYMPNELCKFEPTPEQRTSPYSKAADVWSLGSALVKVLTGHKFEAPNALPSCEDYVMTLWTASLTKAPPTRYTEWKCCVMSCACA